MKLTYWICESTEHPTYSVRAKTKREAMAAHDESDDGDLALPKKVTVEYENGFDLVEKCLGIWNGGWESA